MSKNEQSPDKPSMALCLSRRRSGLTLQQIGECVDGMAYKTVFAQIKHFEAKLKEYPILKATYEQCQNQMANVET